MTEQAKHFIIWAIFVDLADMLTMRFWDFLRSSASLRLLVEFGEQHGVPAALLLAGCKVSAQQLADPTIEISAAQELCAVRNLIRHVGFSPGLGLQLGARYHFSTYGIWGYGLISSETVQEALRHALRFIPLSYAFTRITTYEEGEECILAFGEPELAADVKDFLVERDVAAAAVLLREVVGPDFVAERVMFKASATPSRKEAGEGLFGVRPQYGAPANLLAFDRSFLKRPLPQSDPTTLAMCRQMCSEMMERRRARLGTAALTEQYLSIAPSGQLPSLSQLARIMHTSERSMKRHLQNEGTSFREILTEARKNMADELLGDRTLSLSQVAEKLGFSDISSFSQAFKRWHGTAPGKYRTQLLKR